MPLHFIPYGAASRESELDLYVRPVDGDDDNPGTSEEPFETFGPVKDKLNAVQDTKVRVHVGMHTGDGIQWEQIEPLLMRENVWFLVDGGGAPGDDGFNVLLGPTAMAAGTTSAKLATAGGLVADAFNGKTAEVLTGAAAGDRKQIQVNDANDIYLSADSSPGIAEGDTFRVVEPKVQFILPKSSSDGTTPLAVGCGYGTNDFYAVVNKGKVCIANCIWVANPDVPLNAVSADSSTIMLLGCEISDDVFVFDSTEASILCGIEDGNYPYGIPSAVDDGAGAPQKTSWYGWGFYCPPNPAGGMFWGSNILRPGGMAGYFVVPTFSCAYMSVEVLGGYIYGAPSVDTQTVESFAGDIINLGGFQTNKLKVYGARANRPAVRAILGQRGYLFINKTEITGLQDGIVVDRGSMLSGFFGNNFATVNVPGIGLRMSRGALADVGVPEGDASAISGGAGDISMDNGVTTFAGNTVVPATSLFDTTEGTGLWGR